LSPGQTLMMGGNKETSLSISSMHAFLVFQKWELWKKQL